jgi:putative holliday junction resolvase
MKIMALDIGDVWTGVAISDPLGILARPYTTITSSTLIPSLEEIFLKEKISRVVVGYPKTMRGTESEQTKKTVKTVELLKETFKTFEWILWDERLSSKRADEHKRIQKKSQEKLAIHARAAAFILNSYLEYMHNQIGE